MLVCLDGIVPAFGLLQGRAVVHVVLADVVCAVALVEQTVGIVEGFIGILQVSVAVKCDAVPARAARVAAEAHLADVYTLLALAEQPGGHGVIGDVFVLEFAPVGHLVVVFLGVLILLCNVVDTAAECIDRVVGTLGAELFEVGNGFFGAAPAQNHGILVVAVGIFRIEILGLLIVLGSTAGIVFHYGDVALEQESLGVLAVLGQSVVCELQGVGGIFLRKHGLADTHKHLWILLVVLVELLHLIVVIGAFALDNLGGLFNDGFVVLLCHRRDS